MAVPQECEIPSVGSQAILGLVGRRSTIRTGRTFVPSRLPTPCSEDRHSFVRHAPEARARVGKMMTCSPRRVAPMKICLYSPNYPGISGEGGIGTYTRQLARALSSLGH